MKNFRIVFEKSGPLIFVSHLDFSHFFARCIKRARMPLKYSEGFSPHPKIVFGLPLSVGMTGKNELVDITLTDDSLTSKQVFDTISSVMPENVKILDVFEPSVKLGKITSAEYEIFFEDFSGKEKEILSALDNPKPVTKMTKSKTQKVIDLAPLIKSFSCEQKDGGTLITLILSASGENYLNPELVLQSILLSGVCLPDEYFITRTKILFD